MKLFTYSETPRPMPLSIFQQFPANFNFSRSFSSNAAASSNFIDLSTLLQGRIPRSHLLQIHAKVYRLHLHQDNLVTTRLIGHYPSTVSLRIFNQLENPTLFPFNAIIRVLADEGRFFESLSIFRILKRQPVSPNDLTFSFVLKSCFRPGSAFHVQQIHTHILKTGFTGDPIICNGLIGAYTKGCRDLDSARKVFDEMTDRSMVCCWTSLIAGFAQSGHSEEALALFCLMVKENFRPEDDTIVSVLSACSNLEIGQIENWVKILSSNANAVDLSTDVCDSVNNVLVYLYGKWGMIEKSKERFDAVTSNGKRSVLPWNSMINAYVRNGLPLEALNLFRLMADDSNLRPNHVTMVSVLSACAQIGDLDLGIWVHEYMKSKGRKGVLESNTFLATALMDMYSKCGSLDKAKEVFDQMVSKDVISFNSMIMGLAINGEGREAIELFCKMQKFGLHPNGGTFLGLLWACSHSGLSEEGRRIFLVMKTHFCVLPKLEHFACYIDLLAREGQVEEAINVVASMPFKPNNFIWGALLGGCLLHYRADLAENIYVRLVEADPHNSASYVMLANVFAVDRRWADVSALRWFMREKGVKKQPGCSWISIDGVVHEFLVGSSSHPQIGSIYHMLHKLTEETKIAES